MKWNLNCREATALLLQAQDRRLGLATQVKLMGGALKHWRAYKDQG